MGRKWFLLILISIGLIFAGLGLIYALYSRSMESVAPVPLPDDLAGLPLRREAQASAALAELSMMHNQGFPLNKGVVGSCGSQDEIKVWVAGLPLGFMAGGLLNAMRDAIEKAESPFSPQGHLKIQGRLVYEVEGLGQRHYYFRSQGLIVWVAVDEILAEEVLKSALEFYS